MKRKENDTVKQRGEDEKGGKGKLNLETELRWAEQCGEAVFGRKGSNRCGD